MKHSTTFFKVCSIALVFCLCFFSFGCQLGLESKDTQIESNTAILGSTQASNYVLSERTIEIGGYNFSPNHNDLTQERFNEVKNAGFDFIIDLNAGKDITKLTLADQAGLGWFLSTPGSGYRQAWKNHSSFRGVYYIDEPGADQFEGIGVARKVFLDQFPDSTFHVNLFPMDAPDGVLKTEGGSGSWDFSESDYQRYLDQYIQKVEPSFLSYDSYGVRGDPPSFFSWYLRCIEMAARQAYIESIPFWAYINALDHLNYYVKSARDINAQAYCQLAFGAEVLKYYEYWTHSSWGDESYAIINKDGTRSIKYEWAKEINANLHNLGYALMNYKWAGTTIVNEISADINFQLIKNVHTASTRASVASFSSTYPAFMGVFTDREGLGSTDDAFMLVNFDATKNTRSNPVNISFSNAQSLLVWEKGILRAIDGNTYNASVPNGEGVLIVPVQS